MRMFGIVLIAIFLCSCDDNRLFEDYIDFDERFWAVSNHPRFEFAVRDTQPSYTIYCNLRNAEFYPYSDFRFTYSLTDSVNSILDKKLVNEYLFDKKTGKPFGESGLGDIYDHQFLLLKDYKFKKPGKYSVSFEQFMRSDTLKGVLAVGLRVEKSEEN